MEFHLSGEDLTEKEFSKAVSFAVKEFDSDNDANQVTGSDISFTWASTVQPGSVCVAIDSEVVGSCFAFAALEKDLEAFKNKEINEKQLFNNTKEIKNISKRFVYLSGVVVKPEFRRKGIAFTLFSKVLDSWKDEIITLYAWPFNQSGKKLCKKIAEKYEKKLVLVGDY